MVTLRRLGSCKSMAGKAIFSSEHLINTFRKNSLKQSASIHMAAGIAHQSRGTTIRQKCHDSWQDNFHELIKNITHLKNLTLKILMPHKSINYACQGADSKGF